MAGWVDMEEAKREMAEFYAEEYKKFHCCSCNAKIEVWWSYCAMCGWHLAAGNVK